MTKCIEINQWPEITSQYIYVKSAKHNPRNEQWIGCVLGGCYLNPKISNEDLNSRHKSIAKHYDPRVGEFEFWHGGWESFHLDDIVIISKPKEAEDVCPKWDKFFWEHYVGELRDPEYKLAPDNVIKNIDHIVKYLKNTNFKKSVIGKGKNYFYIERTSLENSLETYEEISKILYEKCKKDPRFTEERFNGNEKVMEMKLT